MRVLFASAVLVGTWMAGYAGAATGSAAPSSDVFLTGVVKTATKASGGELAFGHLSEARAAAGAVVTLSNLNLDGVKTGEERWPQVLASTTADSEGRYTLRLPQPQVLLTRAAVNDNYVNFDLSVSADGYVSQEAVPGYWNGSGWGNPSRPETLPSREHRTLLAPDPATTGSKAQASEVTPVATLPCSFVTTATPTRYTKVAEYHGTRNTNGKWTYGTNADSDIDAGLDMGGDGSWSVNGTVHVGTSVGSYTGAARWYPDRLLRHDEL